MTREEQLAAEFETHRRYLHAIAFRMLGSHADADDAVQEAWLRLGRAGGGGIEDLRGWLTTVTGRICLDALRRRGCGVSSRLSSTSGRTCGRWLRTPGSIRRRPTDQPRSSPHGSRDPAYAEPRLASCLTRRALHPSRSRCDRHGYFARTAGVEPRGEDFDFQPHLSATTLEQVQADLSAAVAVLCRRIGVRPAVAIGFCFAFLAGANRRLDLDAVVGFRAQAREQAQPILGGAAGGRGQHQQLHV